MTMVFCYLARHLYLEGDHQKADRVTRRLQTISEYLFLYQRKACRECNGVVSPGTAALRHYTRYIVSSGDEQGPELVGANLHLIASASFLTW